MDEAAPNFISITTIARDGAQTQSSFIVSTDYIDEFPAEDLRCKFVIMAANDFDAEHIGRALTERIQAINPKIDCIIQDPYVQLKNGIFDLTATVQTLTFFSVVTMFIICVGSVGILLLIIQKRLPGIYISLMLGSNGFRVVFEVFMEIFSVYLAGVAAAATMAVFIAPKMSNAYQAAAFDPVVIPIMLLIVLIISLVSCAVSLFGINIRNPMGLVKNSV